MYNARYLKAFGFLVCFLFLTACAAGDDYFGGNDGQRDHNGYGNSNGYGSSNGYGNSNGYGSNGGYGNYYPYGNANYPRDRIYVINNYNPCNGYTYQGYCYRYKNDYQNAIAWDHSHGYDDNWHRKRKDWCNSHDCSHDHDTRDRDQHYRDSYPLDAQGKPIRPVPVERDSSERLPRSYGDKPVDHDTHDRDQYGRDQHGRNNYPLDAQGKPIRPIPVERDSSERLPRSYGDKPAESGVNNNHQRQDRNENRQSVPVERYPVEYRRPEPRQQPEPSQQPVQREYRQQRLEPSVQQQGQQSAGSVVRQSPPPERQQPQERQPQEQQKPQRARAVRMGDKSSDSE